MKRKDKLVFESVCKYKLTFCHFPAFHRYSSKHRPKRKRVFKTIKPIYTKLNPYQDTLEDSRSYLTILHNVAVKWFHNSRRKRLINEFTGGFTFTVFELFVRLAYEYRPVFQKGLNFNLKNVFFQKATIPEKCCFIYSFIISENQLRKSFIRIFKTTIFKTTILTYSL